MNSPETKRSLRSRRSILALGALTVGVGGLAYALRQKLTTRLAALIQHASFAAAPPLVPHDPARDRSRI